MKIDVKDITIMIESIDDFGFRGLMTITHDKTGASVSKELNHRFYKRGQKELLRELSEKVNVN